MPSGDRDLLPLGTGFDVVRRGYDRGQVEEHLDRFESDLRILTADRDAAVAQASELARALDRTRAHVEELRAQIDRLAAPPDSMEGLSERLQRMLRLAQDEAREMRSSADQAGRRTREDASEYARRTTEDADEHARRVVAEADEYARGVEDEARRQAEEIHAAAEATAAEVRTRYDSGVEDNERRRQEMESEHRALMDSARADAARIRTEAENERRRLDEESRDRREQVEEDFEIAMASRRTESMRVLARSEADARTRAEAQLRDAGDEARRRLREADAEVAGIRRLRARVTTQLATLREALGELPSLDAFPEEQELDHPSPRTEADAESDTVTFAAATHHDEAATNASWGPATTSSAR